ncbi:MAG: BrnA antitoxin family protein [Rhodopila sp.]
MAKTSRGAIAQSRPRQAQMTKPRTRSAAAKAAEPTRAVVESPRVGWATDLVFDVREPKLAVSLRLDADVLRFFRGFGAGYQTRINEVLKAFMQARGGSEAVSHAVVSSRANRSSAGNGKRATR